MPNEMLRDQGAGQTPQGKEEKVHTLEVDALNKTANTEDFSDFSDFDISPEIAPAAVKFETSTGVEQPTRRFEAPQVVEGAAFFDKFGMEDKDTVRRPGLEVGQDTVQRAGLEVEQDTLRTGGIEGKEVSHNLTRRDLGVAGDYKPLQMVEADALGAKSSPELHDAIMELFAMDMVKIRNIESKPVRTQILSAIEKGLTTDSLAEQQAVLALLNRGDDAFNLAERLYRVQLAMRMNQGKLRGKFLNSLNDTFFGGKDSQNKSEKLRTYLEGSFSNSEDLKNLYNVVVGGGISELIFSGKLFDQQVASYLSAIEAFAAEAGLQSTLEEAEGNLSKELLELSDTSQTLQEKLNVARAFFGEEKTQHLFDAQASLDEEFLALERTKESGSYDVNHIDLLKMKLNSLIIKVDLFADYEENFEKYSKLVADINSLEKDFDVNILEHLPGLSAYKGLSFGQYLSEKLVDFHYFTHDESTLSSRKVSDIKEELVKAEEIRNTLGVASLQKRLADSIDNYGPVQADILRIMHDGYAQDKVSKAGLEKTLEKLREIESEEELYILGKYLEFLSSGPDLSGKDAQLISDMVFGEAALDFEEIHFFLENVQGELLDVFENSQAKDNTAVNNLKNLGINPEFLFGFEGESVEKYLDLGPQNISIDFARLTELANENPNLSQLLRKVGGVQRFFIREFITKERGGIEDCLELLEKTASILYALERTGQLESPDKSSLLQQQGESLLFVSRLNESSGPDFDVLSFTKETLYDDLQLMGGTEWLVLEDSTKEESVDAAPQGLLQKVKSAMGFSSKEVQEHNWSVYNSENALENVWTGLTRIQEAGFGLMFESLNLSVLGMAYADDKPGNLVVQKTLEELNQLLISTSETDFLHDKVLDFTSKLQDTITILESMYGVQKLEGEPLELMTEYMTKIKPIFSKYNKYMPAQVGEYFKQFESLYTQVLDGKPFDGQVTFFTAQEVLGSHKMDQLEVLHEAYSTLDKHPHVRKIISEAKSFAVATPRLRGYLLGYAKQRGENMSKNAVSNLFKDISKPEVLLNDILQYSNKLAELATLPVILSEDMRFDVVEEAGILYSADQDGEFDPSQEPMHFFDFDPVFNEYTQDVQGAGQYAIATRKYTRELRKDINQASRIIDFIKYNDNQLSLNEHDEEMLDRAAYISMNYRALDNGHIHIGEVQEALAFVRGEDGRLSELVTSVQESMEEVYNITDELKLIALGGDIGISEEALARLDISYRDKKAFMEAVTIFKAAQETLGPAVFQLMLPFIEAQRSFDDSLDEHGVSKVDLGTHFSTLHKGFGRMKQSLNETAQVFSTLIGLEDKISDASQDGNIVTIAYNGKKYQPNGLTYKQEGDQLIAMLATNNDSVVMELPLVKKLKDGTHQLQDVEVFKTAVVSRLQEAS